ncbi:MAG: glycoside hydrolase family 27 protein, partial [Terracidiphilus sp.]
MRFAAPLSFAALALATVAATAQPPAPKVSHSASQMVARTPPMGWNSWNYFHRNVTQQDVEAAADAMASNGMRDAGYVYVNIDDTWEGTRNADGVLSANSKFPDMKALADYVHSKGLKLGIYSSPGPKTCAGYEASYGHEQQDADLYASWGIDYLKYDLCSYRTIMQAAHPNDKAAQMRMMIAAYAKMDKALKSTGRPIVFSLCQYGNDAVWEWAPSIGGNLWRTTGDIQPNWDRIYVILEQQAGLARYAGPGHWNDPDMLEVGNGTPERGGSGRIKYLSLAENRSHFSMWAMLAAPLLAGNDLATMQPDVLSILTNRDVIAIDQDRLGREATR